MPRTFWTIERIDILRRDYGYVGIGELATTLGCTISALLNQAQRLKLRSASMWTPAEDDYLREHFRSDGLMAVSKHLVRTPAATAQRAWRLGVRKSSMTPRYRWRCVKCNGGVQIPHESGICSLCRESLKCKICHQLLRQDGFCSGCETVLENIALAHLQDHSSHLTAEARRGKLEELEQRAANGEELFPVRR